MYLGHSAFQIKGKRGTVVMDPYHPAVGFTLPILTADVVTVSHQHADHNDISKITSASHREKPFIITEPGEYEVAGISVFGVESFHDNSQGVERGRNTIYTIMVDELRVCHLGDLGHELTSELIEQIGAVDVVFCPVGGIYTIDAAAAVKTIHQLEPAYAIPMHYRTDRHDEKVYADVTDLGTFLKEYGMEPQPQPKLHLEKGVLPEETELVVLASKV